MADEQSTDVTSVTDTSTNEDAQDTDAAFEELDSDDTGFEDGEETEESSESESEDDSAESDDEEEQEESAEDGEDVEESTEPQEKAAKTEESTDTKEQARKAYEARQAEKQARDQAKRDAQFEYIKAAEDDKDLALRQLQIDAYNNKIENNTQRLTNALDKAVGSIELFRTGSPAVKERLLRAVDQYEAMHIKKDQNGDPIEVTGDVFEFLQQEANSIQELLGDGARKQSKDKSGQKARTLTAPVKTPKKAKVDPDLAAFDEEAASW